MIFRERSICYVGNFTKMPQMNKRFSCLGYVSELKRLDKFLISCDVAPLWTFPSEKNTTCNSYSREHTTSFNYRTFSS